MNLIFILFNRTVINYKLKTFVYCNSTLTKFAFLLECVEWATPPRHDAWLVNFAYNGFWVNDLLVLRQAPKVGSPHFGKELYVWELTNHSMVKVSIVIFYFQTHAWRIHTGKKLEKKNVLIVFFLNVKMLNQF